MIVKHLSLQDLRDRADAFHLIISGVALMFAVFALVYVLQTDSEVKALTQEQREKEKPREEIGDEWLFQSELFTTELSQADMAKINSAYIQFQWEQELSIRFFADDGRQGAILFTEDGVVYSGDVSFDESAKMFFDLFWKEYVLENHLRAKCGLEKVK